MSSLLLKKHIAYTARHLIANLCAPLRKLNIYGFLFTRRLNNGQFIWLTNDLAWTTDFFLYRFLEEQYAPSEVYQTFLFDNVDLWFLNKGNKVWNEGEKQFGSGNGISLYSPQKDFYDIFCFYTKKDYQEMNEFYLKNLHLLKKFSSYFLQEAQAIIKQGLTNPLTTPPLYQPIFPAPEEMQDNTIDVDGFLASIDPLYQRIQKCEKLTQREMDCIRVAATGLSAKQIAAQLYTSKRTVEKHLENAKFKLACANSIELIGLVLRYGDIVAKT